MTGTQETDNPAGLYLLQANLILKSLSCTISFHRDTPFLFTRDSPGTPYSTSSCRCSPLLLLLPGAREPGGGQGGQLPPPPTFCLNGTRPAPPSSDWHQPVRDQHQPVPHQHQTSAAISRPDPVLHRPIQSAILHLATSGWHEQCGPGQMCWLQPVTANLYLGNLTR